MKKQTRLTLLRLGYVSLILFCVTTFLASITLFCGYWGWIPGVKNVFVNARFWASMTLAVVVVETFLFWFGILWVYITSVQLGIKYRVLGILCGWIPIVHLVMLGKIISISREEYRVESNKIQLNKERHSQQICKTKYPILLVHGVFFRDFEHLNYWGRIPDELIENGAVLFYGDQNSADSVENSARELEQKILQIVQTSGCEKLNVIAHSKGGLDMRTAIAKTSIAPYIASLTTINTPHRGCEFADYLLNKVPDKQKQSIAAAYNAGAKRLGDRNPDFLAAVYDLTSSNCARRNQEILDHPAVYYQSFGSKQNFATSGRFPLNFSYPLVKYFDGSNDGLVGEKSFPWGSEYHFLTTPGTRGISHGDMIDLNRENFYGFDVREFYVQLVASLKQRGF